MISLIIPTRDRLELLKAFIASIRKYTKVEYEILIGIDGGTDGTEKWLEQEIVGKDLDDSDIKIVTKSDDPKYFAETCNQLARHAHGDFLMFLNDDMLAFEGWIDDLPQTYIDLEKSGKKPGVLATKVMYPDLKIQTRGWKFAGGTLDLQGSGSHAEEITPVHWAGLPFIRRVLFTEVGGFESFGKMGYEDTDLGFKLMARGYTNYYVPTGGVIHIFHRNHYTEEHEKLAGSQLSAKFRLKWEGFKFPY